MREKEDDDNLALKSSFPATCFPAACCSACSWDRELLYKMGEALADECKEQGISTLLGPGVNLKRSPLCGRNFEYFSEDTYLSAELGAAWINGVEDNGIGTSLKHYAANNQESLRMSISNVMDERTLRETYLRVYENVLKKSNPATVMCAYNQINNEFCSDSRYLLTDILRHEWNYKGLVMSDWGATNIRVKGIRAGMDLEMPYFGKHNDASIVAAVEKGELSINDVDICVRRILNWVLNSYEAQLKPSSEMYLASYEENHNLARELAAQSMVLLKNDDKLLPFNKKEKVAVIGALSEHLRHQGSGSSRVNPNNLVSFIDYLKASEIEYDYKEGYTMSDSGFSQELIDEAKSLASNSDKIILFMGLTDNYESESFDRKSLILPDGHIALLNELNEVNKNIAVVLLGGSVVELPWLDKAKGLLNAYLPGEAGGEAIGDVIFGDVCPSGKLAETYIKSIEDNLADKYFTGGPATVEYREGIFIGYKYYDIANKEVNFPFGYGMSYTTFSYSDLKLSSSSIKEGDNLEVSFNITNTGKYDGAEIAQLYVRDVESTVFRPIKELQGFEKVFIKKGETVNVTINLDSSAFVYYNTIIKNWHIESGEYEIMIGSSSRDIKLSEIVFLKSNNENALIPDYKSIAPIYYNMDTATEIPTAQFESIYGKKLPKNELEKKGEYTISSTLYALSGTFVGKLVGKIAPKALMSQVKNVDQTTLLAMQHSLTELPIRALCGMSSGIVSYSMAMGIVKMANGKYLRGFLLILKGGFDTLSALNRQRIENKKKAVKEREVVKERDAKKLERKAKKLTKKRSKKSEDSAESKARRLKKRETNDVSKKRKIKKIEEGVVTNKISKKRSVKQQDKKDTTNKKVNTKL